MGRMVFVSSLFPPLSAWLKALYIANRHADFLIGPQDLDLNHRSQTQLDRDG